MNMAELMFCLPHWPYNLDSVSASKYLIFKTLHLHFLNVQDERMMRFEKPYTGNGINDMLLKNFYRNTTRHICSIVLHRKKCFHKLEITDATP